MVFEKGHKDLVPKGFVIHHMDTNPKNDNINNLVMMPDKDHRVLHSNIQKFIIRRNLNV